MADQPKLYRVTWEIDVEADSPTEAACKALVIQRDPGSTATMFSVTAKDGRGIRGLPVEIAVEHETCAHCEGAGDVEDQVGELQLCAHCQGSGLAGSREDQE